MKKLLLLATASLLHLCIYAQSSAGTFIWNGKDKNYLVHNLSRSLHELIKETENLTEAQWNFRESPDRWSIKQIVEHIGIWELLFQREISQAIGAGPQPDLKKDAKPDSVYVGFILEDHAHVTTDYTKPFTFSVPLGLSDGRSNVAWLTKLRHESVDYLNAANEDLRAYYLKAGRPNVHQLFINTFGHTDRHLRQIRKVKSHPGYPKTN